MGKQQLQISVIGTMAGTRVGLETILSRLRDWQIAETDLGTIEIVLAEALNNIVEHALVDGPANIGVELSRTASHLCVHLTDPGKPMPRRATPSQRNTRVDVAAKDLPEGGFGWNLIHVLTDDLNYRRWDGCNHLKFSIRLPAR